MNRATDHAEVWSLPSFVKGWFRCHTLTCVRLAPGVWLISGHASRPSLLVFAKTAPEVRRITRDFVAHVAPRTDKRRNHWVYT